MTILLEICVDSADGLRAAVAGGADRIELCSALALGGLTPSPGLMALARDCGVPVRAMIRPRDGDFRFGAADRDAMRRDIDAVRAAGLSGVVIGAQRDDGSLDEALLEELVAHAAGLDVTLHRVVDLLPDPLSAVDVAARLGVATILTSGGAPSATEGASVIRAMRLHAGDRVEIMAGSGVRADNAAALIAATSVTAIHASASAPLTLDDPAALRFGFVTGRERATDEQAVAALRAAAGHAPAPAAARDPATTKMHREAAEAPDAVARFLTHNRDTLARIADRLRRAPPPLVVTCARGSSDHAATYGKYLIETMIGVPTASAAPSVSSIFGAPPRAPGALCLAISQSGRSPDLLETTRAYKAGGAFVVALVNDASSPLAELADEVLPLCAGPELSVAATKSYIAALAAQAALVAAWAGDEGLQAQLATLPELMRDAFAIEWTAAQAPLSTARNLFVIGRGYSLAIAQEAALKFKETCGLHAEAFSAAEVRHGPMAIVGRDFPVLGFATSDKAGDDVRAAAAQFAERDAIVMLADPAGGGLLPAIAAHPALEPILTIQSFYRFANALALTRGIDPDSPPHLKKVTQTR
jgi:glucosamine--fructose-6-phosphate aminotransferase (isomerizing)